MPRPSAGDGVSLSEGPAYHLHMGSWSRDSELLEMDGYEAVVTYKNMRTLRVRITAPDGEVKVSAPILTPDHVIVDFLQDKHAWVLKHRSDVRLRSIRPEPLVTGGRLRLWGVWRQVVVEGASRASARVVDSAVHVKCPPGDEVAAQRAVDALYRREMGPAVADALEKWEPLVGRRSTGVKLKRMKSRWGSCNTVTGEITLNTRLAKFDVEALDYVVVHELVHLLERGHGPAFKAHMGALMPDWPARRDLLREGP